MQMLHTYCYISSRSRQQSARLLKTGSKYVIFSFYENLTDIKYFKIKKLHLSGLSAGNAGQSLANLYLSSLLPCGRKLTQKRLKILRKGAIIFNLMTYYFFTKTFSE